MKKIANFFIVFILLFYSSVTFSQSGWTQKVLNTQRDLHSIYFTSDNTGWVVGDSGLIFSTTNAGTNWIKSVHSPSETLVSICFKNALTGMVGGFISGHLAGIILNTTNGGNIWYSNTNLSEPYDFFSLGDTVWCATHTGAVLRSANWGISWISLPVSSACELYTVHFVDKNTGWTSGGVYLGNGYLFKTTNGGLNWFNQMTLTTTHFKSMTFVNASTGLVVCEDGTIFKTTDGGLSWSPQYSGVYVQLFDIEFPTPGIGFVAGENGGLLKSVNSGTNWSAQLLPVTISPYSSFYHITFRNVLTGWAVGSYGTLLKTTNGGEPIGIQQISSNVPVSYSLKQNYPNPFNPSTFFEFNLPIEAFTNLSIFDNSGRLVEILVNQKLGHGTYRVEYDASHLSSGVYFYRLSTDMFLQTKKMILIK